MEANKELRQFNYIASHDLKEPLRTLRTFTGYLLKDLESQKSDRVREDIHYIQDSADRMTRLINDLLGLSRAGYDRIAASDFTSSAAIGDCLKNLTAQIEESRAEVQQTGPELELHGDKGLIVQAIQNLIANAIKFHQPDTAPKVEIITEETPDSKTIGIRDNGIGIAEEYQESIFLAFKRLHGMREYEGSGIGLSIVKKILDRHNASIHVASALGEGSYFQITFPN